jgi:Fe-S-cluster-containing dehydrogenase component
MTTKSVSRRTFLKSALAGGALVAVGSGTALARGLASPKLAEEKAAYALIIDTTKCVGCGACVEACNIRNNLSEGKSYIHILPKEDELHHWFLPVQCQHCANPPCSSVCPTRTTYRRDDGVVMINEKLCVGCKYCEVACPYQARTYDEKRGVEDKCWLCLDYVTGGYDPACVQSCIMGARIFGRQDDPNSEVVQLIASGKARILHPEFGTRPSILYYIM